MLQAQVAGVYRWHGKQDHHHQVRMSIQTGAGRGVVRSQHHPAVAASQGSQQNTRCVQSSPPPLPHLPVLRLLPPSPSPRVSRRRHARLSPAEYAHVFTFTRYRYDDRER